MVPHTILVIDDEPFIRRTLSLILQSAGYAVATANDGEAALEVIRRDSPELVLIDALLPVKDGFAVCEAVRRDLALDRQPHIIMVTGQADEADRRRAESVGADGFVTKPFSPGRILAQVRVALAEPAVSAPLAVAM